MANLSKSLRFKVLSDAGFKCAYCGKTANDSVLEVDHVVPRSAGGKDEITNLVAACYDCNRGKRDRAIKVTPTVALVAAKREQSYLLHIELYCQNQSCPCRETEVFVKDYDNDLVEMLNAKGGVFKCVICRKPMKVHWIRTRDEHASVCEMQARQSVNTQRYERDHTTESGFCAIPADIMCDDTLPA
jgi:hypothetical protein